MSIEDLPKRTHGGVRLADFKLEESDASKFQPLESLIYSQYILNLR